MTNTATTTDNTTAITEWLDRLMAGFTEEQLEVAFECVKPRGNWKLPIEAHFAASVTLVTREQVKTAIDFHAGGGATFEDHADGSYTVRAPGYYEMIGS